MAAPDITERVVTDLGIGSSVSATYTNSGVMYDYAVAGLPFLSAASDERPMERALTEVQKQQIDQSDNPGEQSLATWWNRAQSDWSGGAGQEFMEPASDELVMRSFWSSEGVDPWTPGKLSLLPETTSRLDYSAPTTYASMVSDGLYMYAWNGSTLDLINYGTHTSASATHCTGLSGNVVDVAIGGGYVVVHCDNGNAYQAGVGGTAFTACWSGLGAGRSIITYAKDRWWVSIGTALYAGPLNTGASAAITAAPMVKIDLSPTGQYGTLTDTPDAVLFSFNTGNQGYIYKVTVSASGGVATYSPATVVAELPVGEQVYAIRAFLGAYLCVTTNLGVRFGIVGSGGSLQYGPLSYENSGDVLVGYSTPAAYGRFVYVTTRTSGTTRPGLIRFDVSQMQNLGRVPYAFDVEVGDAVTSGGRVYGFAVFNTDTVYLLAKTATNLYLYGPTGSKVPTGFVESGWVRFGTLENKTFHSVRVQVFNPYPGSVVVQVVDWAGTATNVVTLRGTAALDEQITLPLIPQQRIKVRLVLNRDSDTTSLGPTVDGWQLRALPNVQRQELIRLPLLCFDYERDQHGQTFGYEGSALERWQALRDAVRDGRTFRLQALNNGETYTCTLESLTFSQVAPPESASGFGGVVTVTGRVV